MPFFLPINLLACCLILWVVLCPVAIKAQEKTWFTDQQMVELYDALVTFRDEGIYGPSDKENVPLLLQSYIKEFDPYGRYLTAELYTQYKESLRSNYDGIQMEIERNDDGRIECIPFHNGNASKAGIQAGDRLVSVDNLKIRDQDIVQIGTRIRGPKGTEVSLIVENDTGVQKNVRVVRTASQFKSITVQYLGSIPTLRIRRFTSKTATELQRLLSAYTYNSPLLLDLRGNRGGDMESAIRAAELLLPENAEIVTIKSRRSTDIRHSHNTNPLRLSSIILLQDEHTASAAELFIAALIHNKVAISVGKTSKGKGVAQRFFPLTNGSALLLSYANLIPPNKKSYHRKGLPPTILISEHGSNNKDISYLTKVHDILDRQSE